VRWPGKTRPAKTTDAMISLTDVAPTLVELAGGQPMAGSGGRSFLPLLAGRTNAHREVIFATHSQNRDMNVSTMRCIRTSRYKFILNLAPENKYTTHMDRAKDHDGGREYWDSWVSAAGADQLAAIVLQRYHWRPREELYDTWLDPWEVHNLAG